MFTLQQERDAWQWASSKHSILFENLTKEEACQKEQELITEFNSMNRKYGYNSTSGGDVFTMNDETKQKISQAMMGNKNGLGHPCSEEKKKKKRALPSFFIALKGFSCGNIFPDMLQYKIMVSL